MDDIYDLNVGGISLPDSVCDHAHHIGRRFSVTIKTPNRKSLAIIWKAISCFHGKVVNHCLVWVLEYLLSFVDSQATILEGSSRVLDR